MTVLAGYLGAGKTTLVNHWLRHADGERLMVLVNDFGALPVDAHLIENAEGDTLTLSNGCICCAMGGDLYGALDNALSREPAPDRLLVEASGVAEPDKIAAIAVAEPDLLYDGTLVVVDAERVRSQLADTLIAETVLRQLKSADLLLLNKCDLLSQADIAARIEQLLPHCENAAIQTCAHADVPLPLLTGLEVKAITQGETAAHETLYWRWHCELDSAIDRRLVRDFLRRIPKGVLRLKGQLHLKERDHPHWVQWVGSRWQMGEMPAATGIPMGLVAIGLQNDLASREALMALSQTLLSSAQAASGKNVRIELS